MTQLYNEEIMFQRTTSYNNHNNNNHQYNNHTQIICSIVVLKVLKSVLILSTQQYNK